MSDRLEAADVFRQHEQEFFAAWGHTLSQQQRRVFRDICACRTASLGAHVQRCDSCAHESIAYNSCRDRHCPKCQSTARDKWLAGQSRYLLPVPYCHVVFTLPHELSGIALQNPRLMYDLLFRSVRDALLTIAADPARMGAHLGFLCVLHTWNQQMMHHPHLHCLIPAGGLSPDRCHWIRCRGRFFLPVRVLGARFRNQFLKAFARSYRQKKLHLTGRLSSLQRSAAFDFLHKTLKKKRWIVYAKRPFGGPEQVLKYLARYTHRVAISNGRLVSCENGSVTFWWRDSRNGNAQKTITIDAIEFIRRFLMHVLPAGFVKIRHFGFLANACRGKLLPVCRSLISAGPQTLRPFVTDTQARAADHKCPVCRTGTLRVILRIDPRLLIQLENIAEVNTS
jgi:Putative transposase/Transposase zinc-binding domain